MADSHAYALDFDGVVCDSADETMYSAFRATKRLWPDIFPSDEKMHPDMLLDQFRRLRPVIETGFENIVLMRLMVEGVPEAVVLTDFKPLRDEMLRRVDMSAAELQELFGGERDRWISEDEDGWVHANRMFPGAIDAINFCTCPVYIITTKQRRFAELLLARAGANIPPERIFAVKTGKLKAEVLKQLMAASGSGGSTVWHFVEDRLETLDIIMEDEALNSVLLYLAVWGYNTAPERQRAAESTRVRLLQHSDFMKMQ
mmetsp:Transcript_5681/g.9808  ORF Transcript_5681/g.9808 Transcript_5681/m.9808 type:complete len:258 (-) Transcript_5681:298-1071(-)|eukprot:CAMPEP_0196666002 /NCGR_PEP_ID=MMETSP1086-20130531/63434_1 /TAXON_ID=77921 /ORGANISM="Cyanoptyche  gloeocystis , Strain SAG4.97" /LENGTH=257 /DNA_ID=CAMNT_0042003035 /DNA_START=50 /DNA_END=823 /DNA_ORIENTATION=-